MPFKQLIFGLIENDNVKCPICHGKLYLTGRIRNKYNFGRVIYNMVCENDQNYHLNAFINNYPLTTEIILFDQWTYKQGNQQCPVCHSLLNLDIYYNKKGKWGFKQVCSKNSKHFVLWVKKPLEVLWPELICQRDKYLAEINEIDDET